MLLNRPEMIWATHLHIMRYDDIALATSSVGQAYGNMRWTRPHLGFLLITFLTARNLTGRVRRVDWGWFKGGDHRCSRSESIGGTEWHRRDQAASVFRGGLIVTIARPTG